MEHYQTIGWREGRNPHPLFDTTWYLKNNPDVAASGCEPLEHYCRDGWRKGLSPSPFFDSKWYLRAYQDVAESGIEPLHHYLRYGIREEGRFPRSIDNELAELSDRNFARWVDRHCTRLLSERTGDLRIHSDRETAVNDLRDALATAPVESTPEVSILVVAREHVGPTITCVTAILRSKPRSPFEIVVVAEAGNDESRSIFEKLPRPIRFLGLDGNKDSPGYLNAAAEHASGTHLVFLDSDTIVFPGWLDSLIETLQEQHDVGLVGSKMLSANGRLLEAGRVVLSDGTQLRFGYDDAPSCSKYCYLREVDCCSWQSFAIAKDFWMELGGFDERLALDVYGEADLCFRIRQRNRKVFFQPFSKLVHFGEIDSCARPKSPELKARQDLSRSEFFDRWSQVLHHHENGQNPTRFADRYSCGHVLVVDAAVPKPDRDCGSEITFNFLRILKALNKRITFIPTDLQRLDHYSTPLEKMGVECVCFPSVSSLQAAILEVAPDIDFAFLHRLDVARPIIDLVRSSAPRAKVVFNTIDLHFLRKRREAELFGGRWRFDRAEATKRDELEVIQKADATIVVSSAERRLLTELVPAASVFEIGLPIVCAPAATSGWDARRDIVFLGGFDHAPNSDAVLYFIHEVWPLLLEAGYRDRFLIVGSNMPPEIESLGTDQIIAEGYVENLQDVFSTTRISIAPLRFGAGIKGKVATSLGYGVPCVATSIGVEGSGLVDNANVLVGDAPGEFASQILRVYHDSQLWTNLSQNGLLFFRENYSLEAIGAKFESLMSALSSERNPESEPPSRGPALGFDSSPPVAASLFAR